MADILRGAARPSTGAFLMSLKSLIETGEGGPSPRDVKTDNW
jgi:hypothetical protein